MKTSDFNFDLPESLIAQYPPNERGLSRLMKINRETKIPEHFMVKDLPNILEKGTLMVFNNSRVRKARIFGKSTESGNMQEFLLVEEREKNIWLSMGRKIRGKEFLFGKDLEISAQIIAYEDEYFLLKFSTHIDDDWLELNGHVPLPPYIKREDNSEDAERYQTVYATHNNTPNAAPNALHSASIASPTAGLHFTMDLLDELKSREIETHFITLHVGSGTFLPVRRENIEQHKMHEEKFYIDDKTASCIEKAKHEGRKILAVGTTSVRCLESISINEKSEKLKLRRGEGSTSIFIYPGYEFKAVDSIFTNFHTPSSTLIMLVSAFAGRDLILESYKTAVREKYRFYSYGDACLIV